MKTIQTAFKITAKVEGKSWLTRGTTLTANNEDAAKLKAANVLRLTDEHLLTIEKVTVHSSEAKLSTDAYPYGRLKCTAFFSVEYNKKGMREVFQTIDPKTGRINKPKYSTYCPVILPMEESNGFISFCGHCDFNGSESINKGLQFMADFHELFTPEQVKDIALTVIGMSKVNVKSMCIYAGSTWEQLKPLIENSVQTLAKIANTGENLWINALLDVDAIESTKKPDFNPFTVISH